MMENTELLFLSDTFQFEVTTKISHTDEDDDGHYLVAESTLFYPGGGGQEPDKGFIEKENGERFPIIKASLKGGDIRHYYEHEESCFQDGERVMIKIDKEHRIQNARLHTAGHLLASVVYEELKWPLIPLKGFHYQQGAYVEFDPKEELTDVDEKALNNVVDATIQKRLPVTTYLVAKESDLFKSAFKPVGFIIPEDKPLRLVKIGDYLAYPCGGTHLHHTGELNFFKIKHIKHKKGKLRISYEVG